MTAPAVSSPLRLPAGMTESMILCRNTDMLSVAAM